MVLQLAGQDATSEYDPVHPQNTLADNASAIKCLGAVDRSTLPATEQTVLSVTSDEQQQYSSGSPALDSLLNLDDIEAAATPLLTHKAWAYYYSAADDLHSKALNSTAYRQILLRPRIFVDCVRCSTATTLLGGRIRTALPIFVSPAAMARLAHPDGEAGIARACAAAGAVQIISNNASMTPEQIVADAPADQAFGWQLYVQTDRARSEAMLARVARLRAIKFVVLTLDAPVPGKREHDERSKNVGANLPLRSAVQSASAGATEDSNASDNQRGGGLGRALFAGTAADLTWKTTLPWLARHTALPIVLKGVQTHEDAYIASLYAPQIKAIILSNHGGRAADTAPPAMHTLLEIRRYCPEVFDKLEVYVDGGLKRGTDVAKALCLGAKAVGLGRAALFGLGVGGQAGVQRVLESKANLHTFFETQTYNADIYYSLEGGIGDGHEIVGG